MSLNSTPSANRIHIGFFGCRNAGKSSLVNAVTNQELSVVSDVKGTTTDPVTKTMELLPLGPVVIIDTPGYDDEGELGEKRVLKTKQILNKTDIAVLAVDSTIGFTESDNELLSLLGEKKIPFFVAFTKVDLNPNFKIKPTDFDGKAIPVSVKNGQNINALKELIAKILPNEGSRPLVSDLVSAGDTVLLVIPIDEAAPKGRLILPQQQVIRELLECDVTVVVSRETYLEESMAKLKSPPSLVITDSQIFKFVSSVVPDEIPLTSFSILMARFKGFLDTAVAAIPALDSLDDGDVILIAEGCTHHRQCGDIGSVKLPRWLRAHSCKEIEIKTVSGTEFPTDLTPYKAVIHCGGCMLNEREVMYRMKCAIDQGVPFTNYGTAIAHMTGILKRSLRIIYK